MDIEYAPQDRVDRYEVEVERILVTLGLSFADAAVSDESILSDFYMGDEDDFTEADLQRLSEDLGIPVHADSVIADLAETLHAITAD
jgi:hypothetical protein